MEGPVKQVRENVAAVVLAAGMGKRMKSDLAKVLHPVVGRPLLAHVLDALDEVGVARTVVVIGHQREKVQAAFAGRNGIQWAIQAEQRGTGHAYRMAEPVLGDFPGTVLVLPGDTPLLTARTLRALLDRHAKSGAQVTVLSMRLDDPSGYGRIVRTPDGEGIARIVEEKDATAAEKAIDEVNSAIYAFDRAALQGVLSSLTANNAQGEYYLTDTVSLLQAKGAKAAVWCAEDARELLGINTPEQLAEAEAAWLAMRRGSVRGSVRGDVQ
jgi:bifunctional UDP-N-acetylglucosamine pyrophosphorylase/glucosamine-1-phosphate N-acetyltransferase